MDTILLIAAVLAIVAAVLAFIYVIPEKKREKLNKAGKILHDFLNFKFLIVEKILQAVYVFATAFTIIAGFFMLFVVQDLYFSKVWLGGYGLLLMILGPIVIRLAYEFIMMMLILVKNVVQINNKLKSPDGKEKDVFGAGALKEAISSVKIPRPEKKKEKDEEDD